MLRAFLLFATIGVNWAASAQAQNEAEELSDPRICSVQFDTRLHVKLLNDFLRDGRPKNLDQELNLPPQERVIVCSKLIESDILDDGQKVTAYKMRGWAKAQLRDYAGAINDLNVAQKMSPYDSEVLTTRARVHHAFRHTTEAFADLSIVLEDKNSNPTTDAYRFRSKLHEEAGDINASVNDLGAAIKLEPGNWSLWNARCWLRATRTTDQLAAAEFDCNQALDFSADNGAVLDSRGLVRLKLGRFQEAWNDYDAAVRALPEVASPLYGRGIAALAIGRRQDGNADIGKAKAMEAGIAATYAKYGLPEPNN